MSGCCMSIEKIQTCNLNALTGDLNSFSSNQPRVLNFLKWSVSIVIFHPVVTGISLTQLWLLEQQFLFLNKCKPVGLLWVRITNVCTYLHSVLLTNTFNINVLTQSSLQTHPVIRGVTRSHLCWHMSLFLNACFIKFQSCHRHWGHQMSKTAFLCDCLKGCTTRS